MQNGTNILCQWGELLSYHMSAAFQKIDFQEFLHFPEVFPGGKLHSLRFQEFPQVSRSSGHPDCTFA